jgi:putative ATP-dependent endonuclease of OLD family
VQELGRQLLSGKVKGWDVNKLQPPIFSLLAVEEPENSLSPHHLGRIIKSLSVFAEHNDGQSIVATHSPSLLKRVAPERIRYLRLNSERETIVKKIILPAEESDAHKFVREAVQAYPELYFSKLVVLGEGDSEEILLPRIFQARGVDYDASAISVVPLGGRHVNHFWRLLDGLEIPYVTLLDLDLGRHQGGWGRVRYAANQLLELPTTAVTFKKADVSALPKWNGADQILVSKLGKQWVSELEKQGVFFSSPLDVDFAMLRSFAANYDVEDDELEEPDEQILAAVLGKEHHGEDQYAEDELALFGSYHKRFKLGSKPSTHLSALASLDDATLEADTPEPISRLLDLVDTKLEALDE